MLSPGEEGVSDQQSAREIFSLNVILRVIADH
jgi:hypothetical protein